MQLKLNIAQVCFHQHALWQRATRLLSFHQQWRLGFEELFEKRHYQSKVWGVWKLQVNLLSQRVASGNIERGSPSPLIVKHENCLAVNSVLSYVS